MMFFAPPAAGHVNPTLGLVAELVARGHQVSYAVSEDYASRVGNAGAQVVQYSTELYASHKPVPGVDLPRTLLEGLNETQRLTAEFHDRFEANPPDMVISDNPVAWWGRLLAERWQVPCVPLWSSFAMNEKWSLMGTYIKPNLWDPRMWAFALRARRMAAKEKLTLAELFGGFGGTVRGNLVFLPRSFQFAQEAFGSDFDFVGPCLQERSFQGEWQPPESDRPVCLVSFGTVYNARKDFFEQVVRAFTGSHWHVVLVVGQQVDPASLADVPDNIEVRASVPQLDVLRHASVFITHAGMGSVMEALSFGVPLLTVPQMQEQRAVADRIDRLGLGAQLDESRVTPQDLYEMVTSLSDNAEVRRNISHFQQEMSQAGGAVAAADVVEKASAAA